MWGLLHFWHNLWLSVRHLARRVRIAWRMRCVRKSHQTFGERKNCNFWEMLDCIVTHFLLFLFALDPTLSRLAKGLICAKDINQIYGLIAISSSIQTRNGGLVVSYLHLARKGMLTGLGVFGESFGKEDVPFIFWDFSGGQRLWLN